MTAIVIQAPAGRAHRRRPKRRPGTLAAVLLATAIAGCSDDAPLPAAPVELAIPAYANGGSHGAGRFGAHMTGAENTPSTSSLAQAQLQLRLIEGGTAIAYKLLVANMHDVTQAHIHLGAPGSNGPAIVWLHPAAPPAQVIPGRTSGVLGEGAITDADVTGPLAGQGVAALVAAIRAGEAYANVHTVRSRPGRSVARCADAQAACGTIAIEFTGTLPSRTRLGAPPYQGGAMRLTWKLTALLLPAAAVLGCGGDGNGSGPGDGDVLTTIEITPTSATLYSLAPGNTVQLSAVARNQDGEAMDGVEVSFSSPNDAIATVSADGLVTAAGAGTVEIEGSATFDGVTVEEGSSVTVQVAPAAATVTAPQFAYQPGVVHVSAGGIVTWTFETVTHDVDFTSPGAPADIPEFDAGSNSRTFPTSGVFQYVCTRHEGMTATVTVH